MGIDGCKGGWIVSVITPPNKIDAFYIKELKELLANALPPEATILIDMIIKLKKTSPRKFDLLAKEALGRYHSRVFHAPIKECLNAKTHKEACSISKSKTGKKVSIQSFNLFKKIKEVNRLKDPRLIEYHPEIAFKQLNNNQVVEFSKKTDEGKQQRLAIIYKSLNLESLSIPKSKLWAYDDFLDSLALATVAKKKMHSCFLDRI